MLASKERQLVFNGPLKLLDSGKHARDMVAFLFTDSLLLTQQSAQTDKKVVKKEVGISVEWEGSGGRERGVLVHGGRTGWSSLG